LFVSGKNEAAELHLQDIERTFGINTVLNDDSGQQTMPSGSFSQTAIRGRIAATRASIAVTEGDIPRTIALSRLNASRQNLRGNDKIGNRVWKREEKEGTCDSPNHPTPIRDGDPCRVASAV
jgi:hypothetical protein